MKFHKTDLLSRSFASRALTLGCVLVLAACGGSGGSDAGQGSGANNGQTIAGSPSPSSPPPSSPPPASPTPAALVLQGVVATGAAMANANVEAVCAQGSGSSLSGADGRYQITIPNGVLPCAIRATSSDQQLRLKSVIESSSSSTATAHVTPLTDMVVAHIEASSGKNLFTEFSQVQSQLNPATVSNAKQKIRSALASVVNLQNLDPVADALVARHGTVQGNAHDQLLDTLRDRLAEAKLSFSAARELVMNNATDSLPEVVKTYVRPASASCVGVRSGQYWVIEPANTASPVTTLTMDAVNMTATTPQGSITLTGNSCQLTASNQSTVVMSESGVGFIRTNANSLAIVIPVQRLNTSDLQGTWAYLLRSQAAGSTSYTPSWGELDFDGSGNLISQKHCNGFGQACANTPVGSGSNLAAQSDGSFSQASGERFFVVRTPKGVSVMYGLDKPQGDPGRVFIARKGPSGISFIQDHYYRAASISISQSGSTTTLSSVSPFEQFATKVDSAQKILGRRVLGSCFADQTTYDQPLNQMFYRAPGSYQDCSGNNATISEGVGLSNYGTSISAQALSNGLMSFTVTFPSTENDHSKAHFEQFNRPTGAYHRLFGTLPVSGAGAPSPTTHRFYAWGHGPAALNTNIPFGTQNMTNTLGMPSVINIFALKAGYVYRYALIGAEGKYRAEGKNVFFDRKGFAIDLPDANGPRSESIFTDQLYVTPATQLTARMSTMPQGFDKEPLFTLWFPATQLWNLSRLNQPWDNGAEAIRMVTIRKNDTVQISDCNNTGTVAGSAPAACSVQGSNPTLEQFFATPPMADGRTYQLSDGNIRQIEGARVWVSNLPITGFSPQTFRVWFELGGRIYQGTLIKADTLLRFSAGNNAQTELSTRFNAEALLSIRTAFAY